MEWNDELDEWVTHPDSDFEPDLEITEYDRYAYGRAYTARQRAKARKAHPDAWADVPFESYREKALTANYSKFFFMAHKPLYLLSPELKKLDL